MKHYYVCDKQTLHTEVLPLYQVVYWKLPSGNYLVFSHHRKLELHALSEKVKPPSKFVCVPSVLDQKAVPAEVAAALAEFGVLPTDSCYQAIEKVAAVAGDFMRPDVM